MILIAITVLTKKMAYRHKKIENVNFEYAKETTTRPESRKRPNATNVFSRQRKYTATEGGLPMAPQQQCVLFQ